MCGVVDLSTNVFGRALSKTEQLKIEFRAALEGIREEFDEHLESINENTSEIQANYEYLGRMEAKMDKLGERVEQLQMWMSRSMGMPVEEDDITPITLTADEKAVFLHIYTASRERPTTYADVSKALACSEFLVRSYVTNLIEKGVPILKNYVHNVAYLNLDPRFKEMQAKRNILDISQTTVHSFSKGRID